MLHLMLFRGKVVFMAALLAILTSAGTGFGLQTDTKALVGPAAPTPKAHKSTEADVGFGRWVVSKAVIPHLWKESMDLDRIMPEWVPVKDINPVILEGIVERPHVSDVDFPSTHYTHDFCFHVKPDVTPDKRFTNLLGIRVNPKTKKEKQQPSIEVEWETGLAASNDGNILAKANRKGDSGGFYTAGHKRREVIWNWPTVNDWVHVVGNWVWDRGHGDVEGSSTEIHPPRLVAIRRDLPIGTGTGPGFGFGLPKPKGKAPNPHLATKVDIFASGDGGALWNNRTGVPAFVQKVKMSDRDYTFLMEHPLPRPSAKAKLSFVEYKQGGDTFPGGAIIQAFPEGSAEKKAPHVKITIPWKARKVSDQAIFARTIHLFWEEGLGVPASYKHKVLRVTLDRVQIHNTHEVGWFNDGEYRLFTEVGGHWLFVNEIPNVGNILDDGLGDTSEESWTINHGFIVHLPPNKSFRVHSGGWEADGINDIFGRLMNQNDRSEKQKTWLADNVFTRTVFLHGSEDDPIGEVNKMFSATTKGLIGKHQDNSRGSIAKGAWSGQDTNPNDSYTLYYHIEEVSWPK